jgi:hypothetical protein
MLNDQGAERSPAQSSQLAQNLVARLRWLRRTIRTALLAHVIGKIIACAILVVLAVVLLDFTLSLPGFVRAAILIAGITIMLWQFKSRIWPVVQFRPSLEDMALRIEQTPVADSLGLRNNLATATNLAQSSDLSKQLHPSIELANQGLVKLRIWDAVRGPWAGWGLFAATFALATCLAIISIAPKLSMLALQRVFTPWASVSWPRVFDVRDLTARKVGPLGSATPIAAALVRSNYADLFTAPVTLKYRFEAPSALMVDSSWRTIAMSPQNRMVPVASDNQVDASAPGVGALFEALIEPISLGGTVGAGFGKQFADTQPASGITVRYRIFSGDHSTQEATIELLPPPTIVSAVARISPPSYAPGPVREIDLGLGLDDRAVVRDILPGSRVALELELSKSVPSPMIIRPGEDHAAALARALGLREPPPADMVLDVEGKTWNVAWKHTASLRLAPVPTDQTGLASPSEAIFVLGLREDRPPEATVLTPSRDEDALPTATIKLAGEGRDDVGLASIALVAQIAKAQADTSGSGAKQLNVEQTIDLVRKEFQASSAEQLQTVEQPLALTGLNLKPGDEVRVTVHARDHFDVQGPRAATVSQIRTIRILSIDQLVEQVWNDAASVRRQAIRLAEVQDELGSMVQQAASDGAWKNGTPRRQQDVAENAARLARQLSQTLERINQNLQQDGGQSDQPNSQTNGKPGTDPALQSAQQALAQGLQAATRAAQEASDAAKAATDAENARSGEDQASTAAARTKTAQSQAQALEAIEALARALDQGQDAWSSTRQIQRLAQEQDELAKATSELGSKTVGKKLDELTQADKNAIEDLAQKQDELARRTEQALSQMSERAEQLRQSDPAQAAALDEAARTGQRAGVSQQMRAAQQNISRNMQQQAGQAQQRASAGLKQIADQMRQQARSRDATLRRALASLVESIDALIANQEAELAKLTTQVELAQGQVVDLRGLDQGMIKLQTRTLAAVQQARDAGTEARGASIALAEAAQAQQDSVVALRATPFVANRAIELEQTSLAKLQNARQDAQRQAEAAEQRDQARQRQELREKYAAILALQTEVSNASNGLIDVELDRRTRQRAREVALAQENVADESRKMRQELRTLGDSELFTMAHERVEREALDAASKLRADSAKIGQVVRLKQEAITRQLEQLLAALAEDPQDENQFREAEGADQQSAGGGGGGSGGALPPVAELKLLKLMQQEALMLTKQAHDLGDETVRQQAGELQQKLVGKLERLIEKLKTKP